MFSCEYCKIFKNTLFYRTPQVAASEFEISVNIESTTISLNYVKIIVDRLYRDAVMKWKINLVTDFLIKHDIFRFYKIFFNIIYNICCPYILYSNFSTLKYANKNRYLHKNCSQLSIEYSRMYTQ